MTIITHNVTKDPQLKDPLVAENHPSNVNDDIEVNNQPLLVTWKRSRVRRISSLTTICVFLTAFLVFTTGIIGGVYLYQQFTQHRLRHFRGWCSVPYSEPQAIIHLPQNSALGSSGEMESQDNALVSSLEQAQSMLNEKIFKPAFEKFFDQEFDIDTETEQYERIEVPDFSDGRRGRYIHDFSMNITGIVDLEEDRCFIIPLNRSMVYPPQNLADLVLKLRSGFYEVDTEIVRETYHVETPAITDFRSLGLYIARECGNLPTYRLKKVLSPVFKRSADEVGIKSMFTEFAGAKVSQIYIVNLHNIPGRK